MRPESDALPAHDDNPIKSKQPEDASDKMGGKDEAAEMAAPLRCQEADVILEDCAAKNVVEVSDPVMGGDGTSCTRQELPDVNGVMCLVNFRA